MTLSTIIALLPALLGWTAYSVQDGSMRVRSVTIQNEIIMRIPVQPAPQEIEWVERRGPKCLPHEAIRGAALSGPGEVDFLLIGGRRVRAQLGEDCPGLDFYNGFYLTTEDEQICAGRETIRSRMGGSCPIERFHRLVPRSR